MWEVLVLVSRVENLRLSCHFKARIAILFGKYLVSSFLILKRWIIKPHVVYMSPVSQKKDDIACRIAHEKRVENKMSSRSMQISAHQILGDNTGHYRSVGFVAVDKIVQ